MRVGRLIWVAAGLLTVPAGLAGFSALVDRWIAARSPVRGRLLELGGEAIHVVEAGAGPEIVLVHGLRGSLGVFAYRMIGELARDHRVVAIDRAGSGHSRRAPGRGAGLAGAGRYSGAGDRGTRDAAASRGGTFAGRGGRAGVGARSSRACGRAGAGGAVDAGGERAAGGVPAAGDPITLATGVGWLGRYRCRWRSCREGRRWRRCSGRTRCRRRLRSRVVGWWRCGRGASSGRRAT